jgi:hypothetical protein
MLPSFGLVYSLYIATIATPVNKKKQKKTKKDSPGRGASSREENEQLFGFRPWTKKWQHGGNLPKTRAACWPVASAHFQPLEL